MILFLLAAILSVAMLNTRSILPEEAATPNKSLAFLERMGKRWEFFSTVAKAKVGFLSQLTVSWIHFFTIRFGWFSDLSIKLIHHLSWVYWRWSSVINFSTGFVFVLGGTCMIEGQKVFSGDETAREISSLRESFIKKPKPVLFMYNE